MTNSALDGKPYAGNPHVRIDEGDGASAKSRRSSLLYKCFGPVLAQAMDPDPKARPGSAAELAERLQTCRAPHRRLLIVCGTLVIGFVAIVGVMMEVGKFRYESAARRHQQRVDAESAINTALECMKRRDYDRAEEILKPIARGGYARSGQAKMILEDIRKLNARRR